MVGGSWVLCKVASQSKSGLNQEQRNPGLFEAVSSGRSIVVGFDTTLHTTSKATAKEVPSATWLTHPSEVGTGDPPEVTALLHHHGSCQARPGTS